MPNGTKRASSRIPAGLAVVLALAAGFAGGYAYGGFGKPAAPAALSAAEREKAVQEGYDAAKLRLEGLAVLTPEPETLTELGGMVVDVGDTWFQLEVDTLVLNPLVRDVPQMRKVEVNGATVITARVARDRKTYESEMKAYEAAFKAAAEASPDQPPKSLPPVPSPTEEKRIALKDLVLGDIVVVAADKDVKYAENFVAVTVAVNSPTAGDSAIPPPPPPPTAR